MLITAIHIYSPGDASVGIQDTDLILKDSKISQYLADFGVYADEDIQSEIDEFKDCLEDAFSLVIDGYIEIWLETENGEFI